MRKIAAPILYLWLSSLSGCVVAPPPYEDYALARAAVQAAQDADSPRISTALWNRADLAFRAGERAYKDKEFEKAQKQFRLALRYAERAENSTRLKKFQSGDNFP